MFPLYDTVPRLRTPWVTLTLIALNGLIFLYEIALDNDALRELVVRYGIVPLRLSDAEWRAEAGFESAGWLTFVTSLFLHGNWIHLLGNVWMLWIFGDNVEDRMGRLRFLAFYLGCGVIAGLAQYVTDLPSVTPIIGASGAVAGVLGAYYLLYPRAQVMTLIFLFVFVTVTVLPAGIVLGMWLFVNLVSGLMAIGSSTESSTAVWAHIGGFLAGLLLCKLFLHPALRNLRIEPVRQQPHWR